MKKKKFKFLCVIFLVGIFTHKIRAQVKKEVLKGVFVTFPSQPQKSNDGNRVLYILNLNKVFYSVEINKSAFPYYDKFLEATKTATKEQIKDIESKFIGGFVRGRFERLKVKKDEFKIFKTTKGKYQGCKLLYRAYNFKKGKETNRIAKSFLVRNNIVTVEVIPNTSSDAEMKASLNFVDSLIMN